MTSKNILIFGCHGQDGSLLSKLLLEEGYRVVGLSRNGRYTSENHIKLGIEKDVELEEGSISNYKTVSSIIEKYKPVSIYNLAGQSSVGKSYSHPDETIQSIINGTLNILEATKKLMYPGRIFFAGSSEMFGEIKTKADLSHRQQPISPYAIAKQASFNLVKTYRELYKHNCVTGILFNHESRLRKKTFVSQKIIQAAKEISTNKNLRLTMGNIDICRDWGWAEEYVKAMQIITEAKKPKDQIICTGKACSLRLFIEKVFSKFDLDWQKYIQIDKKLYRPSDILRSCGDPTQLYKDHLWRAKMDIDQIIDRMIDS